MARPDEDIESLITRADDALYQAKRNGRNQTIPALSDAESA
jgi:diguanylate cyclase